jgi:hypothetical protein
MHEQMEAISHEIRIRRMERTIVQSQQLQYECAELARRYGRLINDIYSYSNFTIIYTPGKSPLELAKPVYPPETEQKVEKLRTQLRETIEAHISMYERRRLGVW